MIRLFITSFFTFFALTASLYADEQEDIQAIQQVLEEHYEAWNNHDAQKLASLYADDGDLRTPWNDIGKNQQQIEKIFASEMSGRSKNAHIEKSIKSIRIIKPGVAFVDVESVITGMQGEAQGKYPTLKHHVAFLLVKKDGKWQILSGRPF